MFVITVECVDVKDQSCVRECPVDCIYEGDRQLYIHPDECIDCGACEAVCPVSAVRFEADLLPEQEWSKTAAEDMFAVVGAPGGARRHGPLHTDDPRVSALPVAASEE